jgi:hypothetical protein
MSYVVRDSRLAVVHKGIVGERPIALTEGPYSVDAVTPTGIPTTSVVNVAPGRTTQVRIADEGATAESAPIPPGAILGGTGVNITTALPRWTREFEGRGVEFDPSSGGIRDPRDQQLRRRTLAERFEP